MRCPQCQHQNGEMAKFCEECGAKLISVCPQCGQQLNPTAKFCPECGTALTTKAKGKRTRKVASSQSSVGSPQHPAPRTQSPANYTPRHLAERILAEREAMEARGAPDGERKTITALFADLKGSTALIEDLDPEEARRIIDPALRLMMDAVHRYEGYVAQSLGDGIFALFGAPIAHEDHAHRALYAALLMQDAMRRYADQRRREGGVPIYLRVGVNTGEVVVRSIRKDDLQTDYVPVGHSTNLASRMENLAAPGSIVVSAHTYKLTEGYFEFKALGETPIKGVSEPLPIYEMLGVGPLRTKMQVATRRGLARFVGRQNEMEHLRHALDLAKAGHGQIVGVMGEPGVGKSRLFYEFKLASQRGCLVLETFSVSHGKAYPYLPLIDLLKNYFQLGLHDDERQRREKITGRVLTLDRSLEEISPYLFFLLGIAEPTSPLQQMDPQIRRRRTLEAIKRLLVRESLNQPLMVIFEDLHWLDAETQAFLQLLSEAIPTTRMFLLVNYRPEYQHTWGGKTFFSQLRLDPLGRAEAEEILTILLEEKESPLPSRERARVRVTDIDLRSLKQFILEKTEGNPFFMEEIVQTLREQGLLNVGAPLPTDLHIPTTVQGVLAARIDRLPPDEKALLQTLAVIGKEFSLSLLKRVVQQSEDDLLHQLSHLQTSEFIYERPAFPDVEYTFKHALTQEVAYNSLLVEHRKVVHERAARAIEEVYRAKLDDRYSELAHHYRRSGNTQKAVDYLRLAGQQEVQRSANAEAISHLTTALELLKTRPDALERTQQELTLQIALGVPLMATKGWSAPEVERAYIRARDLCEQLGETRQLFSVLRGLWECYEAQGKLVAARELGEQLLGLAENTANPALLLVAHDVLADNLYYEGQFVAARAHAEQGTALYDRQQHHGLASLYGGYDPGVACLIFEAVSLWALGYSDRSSKKMGDALTLAQELPHHPYSLAWVQFIASWLSQYHREGQAVLEHTEAVLSLSAAQEFPVFMAGAAVARGWALARQGEGKEGLACIHQGLALCRAMGAKLVQSYFLALLAETYEEIGQTEEGLAVLAEALDAVHRTEERFWEAELYRLKGQLTQSRTSLGQVSDKSKTSQNKSEGPNTQRLAPSTQAEAEAEACFLKAVEIAQQQQAKSLELRATTSLARLWQQQGKQKDAYQMLAAIYGWFTEGFDTKDLQEAKALLEELNH